MNFDDFNDKCKQLLSEATNLTKKNAHQQVLPEHILLALLLRPMDEISEIIHSADINISSILNQINNSLEKIPKISGKNLSLFFSTESIKILQNSKNLKKEFNDTFVSPEIILYAIFCLKDLYDRELLFDEKNSASRIKSAISKFRNGKTVDNETMSVISNPLKKFATDLTELARIGKLDPVIGREEEIRRSIQVLSRRIKNNPVLIGEPGVGKTAIVEGLALRIINDDVPDSLIKKKVLSIDLGAIVAGAKFRGEFEERFKSILNEVSKNQDSLIIFIDEIHTLVGAGKADGSLDASNLLKPALARGELHCIGATTLNEYRENIEKDSALDRRFQKILVDEPTREDSISILRGLKEKYEVHHGVKILDSAIVSAVELSDRYINDRYLPDKAIDLMDEAASRIRLQIDSKPEQIDKLERRLLQYKIEYESIKKDNDKKSQERSEDLKKAIGETEKDFEIINDKWFKEKNKVVAVQKLKSEIDEHKNKLAILQREGKLSEAGELAYSKIPNLEKQLSGLETSKIEQKILNKSVTSNEIADVISLSTGIPVKKMLETERIKLLNLKTVLLESVIGQKEAVEKISLAVQRSGAGIQDPNRPIGIFLFLGPTGVGKTELTKALSKFLFDEQKSLFRLDMSEYMEKHSISKLIGSPPGYVGHESGGILTESIRRKPYQVILLDEIEKADVEVFNLLLQVFDEGRLTDSLGRSVNFKNTFIVMTSNIGAELIEFTENQSNRIEVFTKEKILQQVKSIFKPEFLNRIDEVIIFNRLTKSDIQKIVKLQISELQNILEKKKISIDFNNALFDWLSEEGFNSEYGARPLKRVIQSQVIDKIAHIILKNNEIEEKRIKISVVDNELRFELV
tara:strand:- start:749 stop:3331 length:2583 start_codon:yes stop_codon:yes gene_type:complete